MNKPPPSCRRPRARPSAGLIGIDVERPGDAEAREALLDRASGPARFRKTRQRLRAGRLPTRGLSLVARTARCGDGADVGGHDTSGEDAGGGSAGGPLAVDESYRRHRLGDRLMEAAIGRARALGHGAILLIGDAPYYRRFGFERRPTLDLRMPGPGDAARFLGLELMPGALASAKGLVRATGAIDLATRAPRRGRRKLRRVA